jgi:hypothetical protein
MKDLSRPIKFYFDVVFIAINIIIKYNNRKFRSIVERLFSSYNVYNENHIKSDLSKLLGLNYKSPYFNYSFDFLKAYYVEELFDIKSYDLLIESIDDLNNSSIKNIHLLYAKLIYLFNSVGGYRAVVLLEEILENKIISLNKHNYITITLIMKISLTRLEAKKGLSAIKSTYIKYFYNSRFLLITKHSLLHQGKKDAGIIGPNSIIKSIVFNENTDYFLVKPTREVFRQLLSHLGEELMKFSFILCYRDWDSLRKLDITQANSLSARICLEKRNPVLGFVDFIRNIVFRINNHIRFTKFEFNKYINNYLLLTGQPTHVQSIVINYLERYSRMKIYGIDFFTGYITYSPQYYENLDENYLNNINIINKSSVSEIRRFKSGMAEHNLISNFKLIKRFHNDGLIIGDELFNSVIKNDALDYASLLENKYNNI